jgi:hypothetical protein
MNLVINNSALLLEHRQTIELIDAAGATAALEKGCLWITMDGDRRDIVLGAGQSWTVERNGRTLLHAAAPSTLRITDRTVNQAQRTTLQRALTEITEWVERTFRRIRAPYY